ncbi:MAG: hypothetical protein HQM16_19585, partial [Deltaproteobacteria bacterium]|nr:hypothetical protein [Deltaproteobacteria bacterium]
NKDKARIVPIIFVTATSHTNENIFKGYASGAIDYLFKPVEPHIIKSKVGIFLELYKKQKKLELTLLQLDNTNRALKNFTGIVAHDLKNPITAIRLETAVAKKIASKIKDSLTSPSPEIQGLIDKMDTAFSHTLATTDRMQRLIVDLLSYASADNAELKYETFNIKETLDNVLQDLSAAIAANNAVVTVADMPVIQAAPTLIRQLFQNLLANALKFQNKETQPQIQVFCQAVDHAVIHPPLNTQAVGLCQIVVKDNGIGFDNCHAEKIFGAFERLVDKKQFEGSGIGLATCRKIVERHGGSLTARGELGAGSQFFITLPLVKQP